MNEKRNYDNKQYQYAVKQAVLITAYWWTEHWVESTGVHLWLFLIIFLDNFVMHTQCWNWTHAAYVCVENAKYTHGETLCEALRCSCTVLSTLAFLSIFSRLFFGYFSVSVSTVLLPFQNGVSHFEPLLSYQTKGAKRYSILKNVYIHLLEYLSANCFRLQFFSVRSRSRLLGLIENVCYIFEIIIKLILFIKNKISLI